ncbi:MAG: LemA family protein [Owenweeksia sp.]|nr:LemA family protein [Owenweeksia sp.]
MKKGLIVLLVIVGIALIAFFSFKGMYNNMVDMKESTAGTVGQCETSYQRRADLIPNLVSTVKGYADFEQETLTEVIEARSKATSIQVDANNLNPQQLQKFQQAQDQLSGALSRLLVTVERYPNLKANQNFLALQSQLEGTENRISVERRKFNNIVRDYNSYIKKFPQFFIANMGGFEEKDTFRLKKVQSKPHKLNFKRVDMKEEAKKFFTKEDEQRIVATIKEAENRTSGEIRVHLENHTDDPNLEHAKEVFEREGMSKTELRNGVLFYLAVQDHQFSIIGDKGINELVPKNFWDQIRDVMQDQFKKAAFAEGLVRGIEMAGKALKEYFPVSDDDVNELPDEISKS